MKLKTTTIDGKRYALLPLDEHLGDAGVGSEPWHPILVWFLQGPSVNTSPHIWTDSVNPACNTHTNGLSGLQRDFFVQAGIDAMEVALEVAKAAMTYKAELPPNEPPDIVWVPLWDE